MPNRLQYETSPYLLQHAANPVNWYPWSEEAFELARKEHKPVLVSIGYAACHWCHVMEHESFEDPEVAAFMNEHFVCIKVDREEHPDVDHLYMDALQAMTGSGGWPLNMFVTPDKKPFYGGTYFPPEDRYGRTSWRNLLGALHRAWEERPEEISQQSEQMLQHLKQASMVASAPLEEHVVHPETLRAIMADLMRHADKEYGGFGAAPKFPNTGAIQFLLDYAHYRDNSAGGEAQDALKQALLSLDSMIGGGIYDHVGGGFARYATDNAWLVPHFEKMLYDNALLVSVLSNAWRLSGKQRYREVIEDTIAFCNRELGYTETGLFYCALDADSEGTEGKYYTWTYEEWQAVMAEEHPAVAAYFGISPSGNWEGTTILNEALSTGEILAQYNLSPEAWSRLLQEARQRLFLARSGRVRPATDDKVLLSWNALMNTALVDAGMALASGHYLEQAEQHMTQLLQVFTAEDGSLFHVSKGGKARIPGKLDDYAYLIRALCQLAAAGGREDYFRKAEQLLAYCNRHFLHEDRNFYYYSAALQTDILVRKVELYDGATPAANTVMMENLWCLGSLAGDGGKLEQAEAMLFTMKQMVMRYPSSFACWAVFLQRYHAGLKQLVITGGQGLPEAIAAWRQQYAPEITTLVLDKAADMFAALRDKYSAGPVKYYLCTAFHCLPPLASVPEVLAAGRPD